jgi:thioredoxin 1
MAKKFMRLMIVLVTLVSVTSCAQKNEKAIDQSQTGTFMLIPASEFSTKLNAASDNNLIDVRTPEEYASGHLEGSQNIDIYDPNFEGKIAQLDKTKPTFVYCKAGGRSADAASKMKSAGFKEIYDMKGGIMSWTNNNLPITSGGTEKADSFTKANFEALLKTNSLVLIDYYATWCAPCKKMEPVLDKLSREFEGKVKIERINVDDAKSLVKELKIENIPVVTTHKNGVEVQHVSGFQSEEQLRNYIQELLK